MLRLRHQIRRQIGRIRRLIRQHQNLAGTGDHIDVHLAEKQPLGGGHIDIARPHDFVHLGNGGRAVRQGGHRLSAAAQVHPIHPGDIGRRHHGGIEAARTWGAA